MKITIERNDNEIQRPVVTINTETCHYPYAIRNALKLALELDGHDENTVSEVFGMMPDAKVCPEETDKESEDKLKDNIEHLNIQELAKLVTLYRKEELPDAEVPFHYHAEIWSGMKEFILWMESKEKIVW